MFELAPHVYGTAEDTFRALLSTRKSQAVMITGESGAGKTEASRKIMEYIAQVSGAHQSLEDIKNQILSSVR